VALTSDEVLRLIEQENLAYYQWMTPPDGHAWRVAIWRDADTWHVASIGERGGVDGASASPSESEALEDFLARLRGLNKYLDSEWA
jgi:hypothetical protein